MGPAPFLPIAVAAFALLVMWAAVTGVIVRLRQVFHEFKRATPDQRVWAVVIIVGFFVVLYTIGDARKSAHLAILLEQFNVPKSAAVTGLRIAKYSSTSRPQVEAVVQFSQPEFDAYVAAIERPGDWRLAVRSYDGAPVHSYSTAAVRWNDLPYPSSVRAWWLRWGSLSRNLAPSINQGKGVCFVLQRLPDAAAIGYRARGCAELEPNEPFQASVRAALDYEMRTLHMQIR